MTPDNLADLLDALAPDLEALAEPWVLIGSAALMIVGLPLPECQDLDILTTEAGALRLEAAWSNWRVEGYEPDPAAPFRSRFSRYETPYGDVEVMGDLFVRGPDGWQILRAGEVERYRFGRGVWPAPTPAEQDRILRRFGRPKDLQKAARLAAWRDAREPRAG